MPRVAVTRRAKRMMELRDSYARFFDNEDGARIMADLARICRFKSPFDENPIKLARNTGKGEVLTHIQTMAGLSDRQIVQMLEVESVGQIEATRLDAADEAALT